MVRPKGLIHTKSDSSYAGSADDGAGMLAYIIILNALFRKKTFLGHYAMMFYDTGIFYRPTVCDLNDPLYFDTLQYLSLESLARKQY